MSKPKTFDNIEEQRVKNMIERADSNRVHLREVAPPQRKQHAGHLRKTYIPISTARVGQNILMPSSSVMVGDCVARYLRARAKAEALRDPGIVHVKDGKPLTATGAKLLGVPWPQREE